MADLLNHHGETAALFTADAATRLHNNQALRCFIPPRGTCLCRLIATVRLTSGY
jgi:hypothetical protein